MIPTSMQRAGLSVLALLALVYPNIVNAETPDPVETCLASGQLAKDYQAEDQPVVEMLVAEVEVTPEQAVTRLRNWLPEADRSSRSEHVVLRNHARVWLAARHLEAGNYRRARSLLSEVQLDSPVAVRAALLIAESWRLQGNPDMAQAWTRRVAQRYSASPLALEGLLLIASDMEKEGQLHQARALYNLVMGQVLRNLHELGNLVSGGESMVDALLNVRLDESREVGSELIRVFLTEPDADSLGHLREIVEARRTLECMEQEEARIREHAMRASEQRTNIGSFETAIRREKLELREELRALRSETDPAVQEEIAELEQQLAALEERHRTLREQRGQVPDDTLARRRALREHSEEMEERIRANREKVARDLQQVAETLRNRYRDVAGESQLARSDLLQRMALRRAEK